MFLLQVLNCVNNQIHAMNKGQMEPTNPSKNAELSMFGFQLKKVVIILMPFRIAFSSKAIWSILKFLCKKMNVFTTTTWSEWLNVKHRFFLA